MRKRKKNHKPHIDTSSLAFPKPSATHVPKWKLVTVLIYDDGREVCTRSTSGKKEYAHRVEVMWLRQGKCCAYCGDLLTLKQATFDHEDGRGMGGYKRDDRTEKDGQPYNCVACAKCNQDKGSMTKAQYEEKRRTKCSTSA